MTMSEMITRRQSGHLNKIKMAESGDPWELFALLVCGQGKALDATSFPAERTKPDKCLIQTTCSSSAVPLAEGSEAVGEHYLHLLTKGPDPGFHVS